MEKTLTLKEAASLINSLLSTLREIVQPAFAGKHYHYTQSAIDAFIARPNPLRIS